jgi:hypothetical protein
VGAETWINQGGAQGGQAGTFTRSDQEFENTQVRRVFLADLDHDGDADALIAGVSKARVWWNDGRGQFTRSTQRSLACLEGTYSIKINHPFALQLLEVFSQNPQFSFVHVPNDISVAVTMPLTAPR